MLSEIAVETRIYNINFLKFILINITKNNKENNKNSTECNIPNKQQE